jgi:hypothetical protein
MTKRIELPDGMKLIRISKRHRGKRAEYKAIGQNSVRRVMRDFRLDDREAARTALLGLLTNPAARLENEIARWVVEGAMPESYLLLDPAEKVNVSAQTMTMLVEAAVTALYKTFVNPIKVQPQAAANRTLLLTLRTLIQYHPDQFIRTSYTQEIDSVLDGE